MNALFSCFLASLDDDANRVARVDSEAHLNWMAKVEKQQNISDADLSELDREEANAELHAQWWQHQDNEALDHDDG